MVTPITGAQIDQVPHEIELLCSITAPFQAGLPLNEVLHQILRGVTEGLDVKRAELYMLDKHDQVLVEKQVVRPDGGGGRDPDLPASGLMLPITDTGEIMSAAVLGRETRVIEDLLHPGPELRLPSLLRERYEAGSLAAVPLIACGRVVGVMALNHSRGRQPLRQRIPLLNAFAVQAGLAIERALLEEELRASERRRRMVADLVTYSADAIVSLDPDGRITSWNRGAEKIFGYSSEEMLGETYQTLVPQDRMDEFCHTIRVRAEKEGHLQGFETERLHKDGRRIPVSLTVTHMLQDGGPELGWSVVVRDITERRGEEQRRRLLSSITEQSPDAILSLDREGRITSWNLGAKKMFGYEVAEIIGHAWLELAPTEREADYRIVTGQRAAEESRPVAGNACAVDTVARTREGRLLPVRLSASVLRAEDGSEVGWSVILRDLTEQKTLAEMSERLQEELCSRNRLEGIVGDSRAMEEVRERIRRVARFSSSVMLVGGSGTGKEIVANAIHYNSLRRQKPFIKVNCAAIPEDLLESELFGIERNVATGVDGRIGRFEMADGGTLFLDEIGDMSLATQAKILRVLQEREFERVGGKKVIKVDVRIIAATNKDLEAEIRNRRFRDDLYYRLNVILITLPPLAERREDIDPLIDHFLAKVTLENNLPRRRVSLPARVLLNAYDWPGNVRELEHCIERAVVMGEGTEIEESDLPPHLLIWKVTRGASGGADERSADRGVLADVLLKVERRAVSEALERADWVQARAARLLGISERSMWYRVKKLGLQPPTR